LELLKIILYSQNQAILPAITSRYESASPSKVATYLSNLDKKNKSNDAQESYLSHFSPQASASRP
jgi:hypothetical protein